MRVNPKARKPEERIKDFYEVVLGYTPEEALTEAKRCLGCVNAPCAKTCPVHIDIPAFIKALLEPDCRGAYRIIRGKSMFAGVCGRVCPQEGLCEGACVLKKKRMPINIGKLERFVFDCFYKAKDKGQSAPVPPVHTEKVAIAGSGPSGLSCAYTLSMNGYPVSLFESLHDFGGVLKYGIPEFRLPKYVVDCEIDELKRVGVTFHKNVLIGKTLTFADLFRQGFKAILVASGAGLPKMLYCPGENLNGVYSANEFLFRVNFMKAYEFPTHHTPVQIGKKILVIGGGNVAVDCARVAKRLGAAVSLIYRRTKAYMPARIEEVEHAEEEGVAIHELLAPVQFIGDEKGVQQAVFKKTMLVDTGQLRPDFVTTDEEVTMEADTAIIAIGQDPNRLIPESEHLLVTEKGTITVDANRMTSRQGVFASGDIISGADTVIAAMESGTRAAFCIMKHLREE